MKHARDTKKSSKSIKTRDTARTKKVIQTPEEDIKTYSRQSRSDSLRESMEKKHKDKKKRRLAKLRAVAVILLCVCIVAMLGIGSGMYAAVSKEIDDMDFDSVAYNFSSTVYANVENGNSEIVAQLQSDGNREWIDSGKIPDIVKTAAVSIEDERFYKHKGVDLKRTFGATFWYALSKITHKSPSYGGSTITQQVIKNITNEKDKTAGRKVKEMMRAIALEKRFTKDEILTTYLNIVYFGNQCYGIESASKIYFSKSADKLTLPEAAMIVGITQAPSRFNPFKNPEAATEKRNRVLSKMYELGKISEDEYNKAKDSPLGVNKNHKSIHATIYNYFVDQVISDVVYALQTEKGYSKDFATQQVFNGGFKIYTTMDPTIQDAIDNVYSNTGNFPGASGGTQSSMVIIDPYTGEIKGMAGGIGKKTTSRGLNRATQAYHQPGSSIKPLSVYSPALETKKITAASILTDEQITLGKGTENEWSPKNSYKGFKGDLSVRKAIEISANIPAVKTLQSIGLDTSYSYMTKKYHFSSLVIDDKNLSPLSLGGLTKGVSAKEMAAGYSVFVNGGVYITPHTYTKVLDNTGKVLLEFEVKSNRVISEENAFIMTSFLSEVVNGSAGTGRRAKLSNMPTYGKTGTTNSNFDKWFVGFTPYYVGAVWYGYDKNPKSLSTNASVTIWNKVMTKVHENLPQKEIEEPKKIVTAGICQRTGKLASPGCAYAKTEYFAKGNIPVDYCKNSHGNYHKPTGETTDSDTTSNITKTDENDEVNENNGTDSGEPSANTDKTPEKPNTPASQKPSTEDNVITLE